jgi:putative DNA primase/helicase
MTATSLEPLSNSPFPTNNQSVSIDTQEKDMHSTIDEFTAAAKPDWHSLLVACAGRSDQGAAELMAHLYVGQIVYDHSSARWHKRMPNGYWQLDIANAVSNHIPNQVAAQYLQAAAAAIASSQSDHAIFQHAASKLCSRQAIDNVLQRAKAQPRLHIAGHQWDDLPNEIAAANGIISLTDGTLRQPRLDEFIRTHTPTVYDGLDAKATLWHDTLLRAFGNDLELVEYFQRCVGYAIVGTPIERVLIILQGVGANGKTTILEALHSTFGPYCYAITSEALLESPNQRGDRPQPALYGLQGKRLVWASETGEGRALNAAQIKLLTGNDSLTVHAKYTQPITFQPSHCLFLSCNHLPRIIGDDQALWDRVRIVPFMQRFVDMPVTANEHKRDPLLLRRLRMEASGILAWAVRGAIAWRTQGLQTPNVVGDATADYRRTEDTIGHFLEEATCQDREAIGERACDAYEAYQTWCQGNGHRPLSMTNFGKALKSRGIEKERTRDGIRYSGLTLTREGL